MRQQILVVLLTLCHMANSNSSVPDLLFHAGRSMGDIHAAGLAWSGSAFPRGPLSVYANPSLPHSFAKGVNLRGLLSAMSYSQQGPLYGRNVVTAGVGYYSSQTGTVLNTYRFLGSEIKGQTEYQTCVAYANEIFEPKDRQGGVDMGISLRYEQCKWNTYGLPVLHTFVRSYDTISSAWQLTPVDSSTVRPGSILEKRLLLDIGFFQPNVLPNLDFALVGRNILGYVWNQTRPWVEPITDGDSLAPPDTIGTRYVNEYRSHDAWIDPWYRSLVVGALFFSEIVQNKLMVRVPLDLEFVGLFQRRDPRLTLFRVGMEVELCRRVLLRIGYGREPELVEKGRRASNENILSGGLGFRYKGLAFESCAGKDLWGLQVTFVY